MGLATTLPGAWRRMGLSGQRREHYGFVSQRSDRWHFLEIPATGVSLQAFG